MIILAVALCRSSDAVLAVFLAVVLYARINHVLYAMHAETDGFLEKIGGRSAMP
jgi:hypothetical protein